MTELTWLPPLVVLGAGLAVGLLAAARFRSQRRRRLQQAETDLRLRDLEERRDDIFQRLRSDELGVGDRLELEKAAARTLRDLDQLQGGPRRLTKAAKAKAEKVRTAPDAGGAAPAAAEREAAPAAASGRHPVLVGFVAGLGLAVLLVALVYWAVRDSGAGSAQPATATMDEPHDDAALAPEVRQAIERLEAEAAANPTDLLALKRLALARLDAGLYFDAFNDAGAILVRQPEDPDGLFIEGVVRLAMGQSEAALDRLDRVLARFPEHLQAMIYRGLALAQAGDLEQAVATWEMGLEMAGGSHPEIERLLRTASEQSAAPPPAAAPPAAADPPMPPAASPGTAAAPTGIFYRATLELAGGGAAPAGAVLFVYLRPGETGPPVAVRRIDQPRFPLEVVLDASNSMMGSALPPEGFLVARLDGDGDVSSRGPADLETSLPATAGEPLRLVLGGS